MPRGSQTRSGDTGKEIGELRPKVRVHDSHRWIPRREQEREAKRGISSRRESFKTPEMSSDCTLNSGDARTAKGPISGFGLDGYSAISQPSCRSESSEGITEGVWATVDPTPAFWLDFPEHYDGKSPVDQVSLYVEVCIAAPLTQTAL